jgi:hypothetical protein
MKYKTAELTGALLDAAVAVAEGEDPSKVKSLRYSRSWRDGGRIIERERIDVSAPDEFSDDERWFAGIYHGSARHATPRCCEMRGDTPLIAAMRAYVAHKLGEEVEL